MNICSRFHGNLSCSCWDIYNTAVPRATPPKNPLLQLRSLFNLLLLSTHLLIHSPIPRSLQSIIHPSTISSFHSSSSLQHLSAPLLMLPFIHWLNTSAPRCQIPLSETSRCILWSSAFFTGAENMQAYKQSPTHDIIPPDGCQSFHPPPTFTLYIAGVVDTLLTISLQQTMSVQSADHNRFNIQGAAGGFWDTSNTSGGGTKNTHTQGSTHDLPPESIRNMQK